ncbi:unnamed protein product [Ambrosiozyma monospora]|uniref:Unnamed protein product n=1 Tax=Ambrosiozyma monospora TaxID=43982 RepID=A0ACB5TJZ9_AMBMO|nr:unnamed protein product [Ambrosiozyma monospora]
MASRKRNASGKITNNNDDTVTSDHKNSSFDTSTNNTEDHQQPNQIQDNDNQNQNEENQNQAPVVDITLSRTNNIILIPQLEVIDKELAYKQRMHRPFKVVQNLPLSVATPDYSLLDHPLSVKDSATLCNSLIVSRHNWLYNVFRTYWTRREQYINVLNDRKRDRMNYIKKS